MSDLDNELPAWMQGVLTFFAMLIMGWWLFYGVWLV